MSDQNNVSSTADVLQFLILCADNEIGFKVTGGNELTELFHMKNCGSHTYVQDTAFGSAKAVVAASDFWASIKDETEFLTNIPLDGMIDDS